MRFSSRMKQREMRVETASNKVPQTRNTNVKTQAPKKGMQSRDWICRGNELTNQPQETTERPEKKRGQTDRQSRTDRLPKCWQFREKRKTANLAAFVPFTLSLLIPLRFFGVTDVCAIGKLNLRQSMCAIGTCTESTLSRRPNSRIEFAPPPPTPDFLSKDFPSSTRSRTEILTKENLVGAKIAPTAVSRTFPPLVRGGKVSGFLSKDFSF